MPRKKSLTNRIRKGISKRIKKLTKSLYFWDILALTLTIIGLIGYYITQILRHQGEYLAPTPEIALLSLVFEGLITATLIGWIAGTIISKARRKG